MALQDIGKGKYEITMKDGYIQDCFAVQTDSARVFEFQVIEDAAYMDISNLDIRMYVADGDSVAYANGSITDGKSGRFKVELFNGQLRTAGKHKAQIEMSQGSKSISSPIFIIEVDESLKTGSSAGVNLALNFENIKNVVELANVKGLSNFVKSLKVLSENEEPVIAEKNRISAEKERVEAESTREKNEKSRVDSEELRSSEEEKRAVSEKKRIEAENSRDDSEEKRVSQEEARVKAEKLRDTAEKERIENENKRVEAESTRVKTENEREKSHAIVKGWLDNPAQFKGEPGLNGKSALDIWHDLGNSGDNNAFIDSLKGKDGTMTFEDLSEEQKASLMKGYATEKYVNEKLKKTDEEQRDFIEKEVKYRITYDEKRWHVDRFHYRRGIRDYVRLFEPLSKFYEASFSPEEKFLKKQRENIFDAAKLFFDKNGSRPASIKDSMTPGVKTLSFIAATEFYISEFAERLIRDFIISLSSCVLNESNKDIAVKAIGVDLLGLGNRHQ
ncbi:BppU family phage baseplate upper protein [Peptostreptococcus anaerobius]|uniref:BppU family phage baseplate upper protein n=1 Tax=Peptostreptococcus anaerobius TaxID=1261 RepID=UPI0034A4B997